MKQWKLWIFINACPLSLHLLNFLCDKMESPSKALLLPTLVPQLSPGKAPVQLFESQTERVFWFFGFLFLVCVFFGLFFFFYIWNGKWLTTVVILFGAWQTFSQKWMKWACCFKENNRQYLSSMIKFEVSTKKNDNFRTLVLTTTSLTTSQYLKYIQMRLVIINECNCFYIVE